LKKLLVAAAVLALMFALAFAVGSMRWRPSRRAGPPRLLSVERGAGPLLAGAAVVPVSPSVPVPVAGFARLHWMEEGRRDPVAVRALALREPGCTVVLVSAELLLIPSRLERAIERSVRDLHLDLLIVAATHTHAGPGGFWNDALGERLATGPYDAAVFEHLVEATGQAVRKAVEALEPAYLSVGRGEAPELARNRSGGDEVDGRLVSAQLVALTGKPIAELVLYPAHATLLGVANRLVSGDWPGALMRARPDPVLLFQGALGDQAPVMPPRTRASPEGYARALRTRLSSLQQGPADPWPELAVASATAVLPAPVPGAAPPALRRVVMNLFYDLVPDRARIAVIRLGPLVIVAVPGEPVAEVGRRWRQIAGEGSEILSLAGDYLGYIETSERMAEAAGETVHTYYGPDLADRLAGAVSLAARAVREPQPEESPKAAAADGAAQNRTAGAPRSSHDR
jgi:hypothetical protein